MLCTASELLGRQASVLLSSHQHERLLLFYYYYFPCLSYLSHYNSITITTTSPCRPIDPVHKSMGGFCLVLQHQESFILEQKL